MEIRPTLLQQLSQAVAPATSPALGVEPRGGSIEAARGGNDQPRIATDDEIPNLGEAVRSGDSSLILSTKEKEILQVLFVNQTETSASSGFRLYSGTNPKPALRGSFVDLKG